MKKNTILLLGGTGTISFSVMLESVKKGYEVTIMNRGNHNKNLPEGVNIVIADINDPVQIINSIRGSYYSVIVDFLSRNSEDVKRIYPILAPVCMQYIFISSCCVFTRDDNDFPLLENSPKPNYNWSYSVEKYEAEKELVNLSNNYECVYTIVRPYITYNEKRLPYGLAPSYSKHRTLIERLKNSKELLLWNDGENTITITHSIDFAKYLVGLYMNSMAFNEDFNLVSDYKYTYKEIVALLCNKLGVLQHCVKVDGNDITNYMPDEKQLMEGDRMLNAEFDNSKIKRAVSGLSFEYSLDKGLDMILDYYSKSNIYDYDFKYDALIDRIESKAGCKDIKYIRYTGAPLMSYVEYNLYRYFPYKVAQKINKIFVHR